MDPTDPERFPGHGDWWKKYCTYLKRQGKGSVDHKKLLHADFNISAMELAHHSLEALLNRSDPQLVEYHKSKIPVKYRHLPHMIIQNYAIMQVIQYGVRRGAEGISMLKESDFEVREDEVWGFKSYVKVTAEISKNHQDDAEVTENCGIIPFLDLAEVEKGKKFNPGKFFQQTRHFYPTSNSGRLFLKPCTHASFNVWDPEVPYLFHSKQVLGRVSL